jgi:hypothetical protein
VGDSFRRHPSPERTLTIKPGQGEPMNQRFELRNSLWRNAVLFVISLGFTLPILLLNLREMWWGAVFFGLGAILFGYRTFDRRVKVVVDENGIQDTRTDRYGLIRWQDIRRFEFTRIKGNYFLNIFPRHADGFPRRSSKAGAWLDKKIPTRLAAVVSLQNMDVDVSELGPFISKMIVAHAPVESAIEHA